MIIRLAGDKEFEKKQKILFSLFMSAIQLIRESRLRPRLMDSVYNFTNIGVMLSPLPLRHCLREDHDPQDELYCESDWEFPLAVHGMSLRVVLLSPKAGKFTPQTFFSLKKN